VSDRIGVLIRKEWRELRGRKALLLTAILVPLIILIVSLGAALLLPALEGDKAYNDPEVEKSLSLLIEDSPELMELDTSEALQILMLRHFLLILLIVPVVLGTTITAYSIVGEKISRSLEPLLATPLSTTELLLGKLLASAIPAILISWAVFGIYALAIIMFTPDNVFAHVINLTALGIIFLICPLVALLGLLLVIIASSRFSDPRSAQQVGVVVILPLVGIMMSQMMGLFLLTPILVLIGALILAGIDVFVLKFGVNYFKRETILTRWK